MRLIQPTNHSLYSSLTLVQDTDQIYEALKSVPNYQIYKKSEIPQRYHYRLNNRIGPLVMVPNVSYELFRSNRHKFDWSHWSKLARQNQAARI